MIDCNLLAKVYINLTDQKEPTLNFQNQNIEINSDIDSKNIYYKKVVKLSEEELIKHNEYLKNNLKEFFNLISVDIVFKVNFSNLTPG